jgi:hypothetical protein
MFGLSTGGILARLYLKKNILADLFFVGVRFSGIIEQE